MPLSPKQQRFVEEYLIDLNGAGAARRAGYAEATANREGSRLLANAVIQEAIAAANAERARRTGITADAVLQELARIAFSDMRRFSAWGPDGVKLNPSAALEPDAALCVAEVSQTVTEAGGTVRFKLHDKVAALELLGKHLALFTDKLRLEGGARLEVIEEITDADPPTNNPPAPGAAGLSPE